MAGDHMAGRHMAGKRMAGKRMAGKRIAGKRMAGKRMAGQHMAIRRIAALLSVSAALATGGGMALAQTPAAIAAPDATPVVTLHAEGAQIYECKAGDDSKLAWAFREPIATLILDGKTVGRHYAGPTWEYADGGAVQAKAAGSAPGATANDIAWLKLDVVSHRGAGTFANVDIVQRINTSGGVLRGPCEQAGVLRSAPYSADYVFLHKGS
jgi:hypothetical protein